MSQVRERILDVASDLFYRHGIKAVGVDAIISQADVARMSFYRHFRSKDGLVVAYLERRDEAVRVWFEKQVRRLAPNPRDRPLVVFDVLALRFRSKGYRGCGFINAIAEVANPASDAHGAAAAHKLRFQSWLAKLLREAGLDEICAADLLLLFEGATAAAVRQGTAEPAHRAKRIAALLLGTLEPRRIQKRPGTTRR
ncbi:MAG: TetR/AcrR family transcriptional regulator [Candidatus Eisenbacteria bacterium]|uniref:TetR/AcrR family transcriptional regulator n=1 Tax=Eiseniibacteriota bacterium TaxID=2212470 RepID=A0A849SLH2_UNCEI|nr:TetR/AcrR family transcriptional regulator [Candidatus Eisenbacteria bacterium]